MSPASGYRVREMYPTLQGEGFHTGRAVVLLRFEGCNLDCSFCDTDFNGVDGPGGGVFSGPAAVADAVEELWTGGERRPWVLCTGGEPLLQLDRRLIGEFRERGFTILLETNGTIAVPSGIDWVCVSPKNESALVRAGDELKIVWPSDKLDLKRWESEDFTHRWLQPLHDGSYQKHLSLCVRICMENPSWRLSMQMHRYAGLP